MFILATGAPGEAKNVICPAVSKFYVFRNDTTGGFALTLKTPSGTGIAVPAGQYKFLYCDGTNVVEMFNSAGALTLSGALSVGGTATFAANPTLSAGTANQVQYLNASKVLTGSSNLTFDGTSLTLGGNPTLSAGTANGVLYLNGSKVATSGTDLVFSGTNGFITSGGGAFQGATAPSSGAGIELSYGALAGVGRILGYNRTGAARVPIVIDGSYVAGYADGIEGMRLTSTGLGIGTSSPAGKLTVKTGTNENLNVVTGGSGDMRLSALNDSGSATVQLSIQGSPLYFRGVGGAINATLDSSGNLGLGVTPSAIGAGRYLQVLSTTSFGQQANGSANMLCNAYESSTNTFSYVVSAAASRYNASVSGHQWYTAPSGTAGNAISFTQAMTLDASGTLLVNRTAVVGLEKLSVNGGARLETFADIIGGAGTPELRLYQNTNNWSIRNSAGALAFYDLTGSAERARITSGGYFKASNTGTYAGSTASYHEFYQTNNSDTVRLTNTSTAVSGAYGLYVDLTVDPNATDSFFVRCFGGATQRASIRSNGGLANYSANNVNLSDRREKTNFAPAKSYLDTICAIPVQTFEYIDQSEDDPGLTLGVVAQDVQAVAPELVMESNWGTADEPKQRLSIYQTDLQYALMKCIQEQQALITDLRARVEALESN
jgi:hypothetical protein